MYTALQDFLFEWREESEKTLTIFEAIDEDSKSLKEYDNLRSLERLAWHITQNLTEMPFRAGLIIEDLLEKEPIPKSINSIISQYKIFSKELIEKINSEWKDEDLLRSVKVYGQEWNIGKILDILVKHQIHHRGQITTLMRINGMKVPGIYGPSKEEWKQFGMQTQE